MFHALFVPPVILYFLGALGLLLVLAKHRRLGWSLWALSALALVVLSLPVVGQALLRALEVRAPIDLAHVPSAAGAIVILGAGIEPSSPEYPRPSLDAFSLERVRYGAFLARATGLPILTSGGKLRASADPIGVEMARVIEEEFQVPVRWIDSDARNTWENAKRAKVLLEADGIDSVLLVTHAWHMPRARYACEHNGLRVTSAPTGIVPAFDLELSAFLPSAKGLMQSALAFHEWLGARAYALGMH